MDSMYVKSWDKLSKKYKYHLSTCYLILEETVLLTKLSLVKNYMLRFSHTKIRHFSSNKTT